ncbi:MAG: toll/interleukin-1 receptor domain-containing protein [Acidimicrobiales bacterium]
MTDVFVSYSRHDTDFVRRIAASMEERGKTVWLDTEGIADTEVFPQAIRRAIEGADALLFVITPASASSAFCEQEVAYARTLEKRIVPVLHRAVPDSGLPEEIRDRNWIPFTEGDDYSTSVERVVRALDTDLELRKEHTRWLVKALEWDGEGRDRSFLLRGSELKAAESWLARTTPDADPAPTALQNGYILASRRAAARRQRALLATSMAVAVAALALGAFALASRNQAVAAGKTARAEDLAAESQVELSADPEVSVLLARRAVELLPIPQTEAALRQAIDASPVRLALPTQSGKLCGFLSGPAIAYSPTGGRLAESLCTGDVVVLDTATGHVVYQRHLSAQASAVAYDPSGRLLAVGTNAGIDLLDPATGAVTARLVGHGEPNSLAFSPDGTLLAATTTLGTTLWDLASGTPRYSIPGADDDYTAAFTTDGHSLVVGTGNDATAVYDVASGQLEHLLAPQGQPLVQGTANAVALRGDLLAVGVNVSGPGDISGDVDLWDTQTWTMIDTLTTVTGTDIADVAISPDGKAVAVGNTDGTGSVWSIVPNEELVSLQGQTASLNSIDFSPDGADVAAAAYDGTARIYRADGPWLRTLPAGLCGCGNEIGWQNHRLLALARSGNDAVVQSWALPSGRLLPDPPLVSTDQEALGAVLSRDGRLLASWTEGSDHTTVQVRDVASQRVIFTLPATTVAGVSFSADDRLLAVLDDSGGLHVTTLASGRTVVGRGWPHDCESVGGESPAISADDRLVAVYSFCGTVGVGRIDTARPFETYDLHGQLSGIAFDPPGNRLAVSSWDDVVTVLNVATDRPVFELIGDTRGVNGVTYSPTGRYLITTGADGTLRVWDASNGQLLQVNRDASIPSHPSVSPNGRLVAENNNDSQIRVWAVCPDCLDPSGLLAASRSSVVSPLTPLERAEAASPG